MSISGVGTSGTVDQQQNLFGNTGVLGKDDFLSLLVTQLRNQDPLDPQTNEQFVSQLAQFSALEQAQNMNSTLQANSILTQSVNNALSASLIGKEVQAAGDQLAVGDTGEVKLPLALAGAGDATITIKDAQGNVVRTLHETGLKAGLNDLTWDGLNDAGQRVSAGNYSYSAEAKSAAGDPVEVQTYFTGVVSAVKFVSGNAVLVVDGRDVPLSAVQQISQAGTGTGS